LAVASYQGELGRAENVFWLKYFLSFSQSAILWMSVLLVMSTVFYWIGMFSRSQGPAMEAIGSRPGLGGRGAGADRHPGALVRELPAGGRHRQHPR
jgi:hypothetical protein